MLIVFSITPVFAEENHTVSVINTVGLGNVHIAINQYDIIDNQKVSIAENPTVLPGQKFDRVCEITNFANEVWVRAKIVFSDDSPNVNDDFLTISSNKWKKIGEYFYYTEEVKTSKSVELFNKINIPAEWGNDYAKKTVKFTVFADAVQSKNFTPDFDSEDPWFGTIIEHRVHDDYVNIQKEDNSSFSIIYENGSEGLVKVGDDFFSNWNTLMPGDVVSDKVLLKNNYALPTTIYFRTNTISDDILIKELKLRIYTKEKEIFSGSLYDGIKENIVLAKLSKGEELEVVYELSVPTSVDNKFSLMKTKTEWIFSAHSDNMPPPSSDSESSISKNENDEDKYINNDGSSIKTGDTAVAVSVCLACVVGLPLIYIAIVGRRRKDDKK